MSGAQSLANLYPGLHLRQGDELRKYMSPKRSPYTFTFYTLLQMAQPKRMSSHQKPLHAQAAAQRRLAEDRPSDHWNTSLPHENKQDTLQSNQAVTRTMQDDQTINNGRSEVCIHVLCSTSQRHPPPLCPLMGKTNLSVRHLFPIRIHLEVSICLSR